MSEQTQVVFTGIGVVSPIGIGLQPFWASLCEGRSGVKPCTWLENTDMPVRFGGEVQDFDPKIYVKPRKSLKVMCREIQMGFAAASMAVEQAGLESASVSQDRFGVVFGSDMLYADIDELIEAYDHCRVAGQVAAELWGEQAMKHLFPLWMLKYLPNMSACHIGIAHDARGPSNSIVHGDVSSLLAITEAVRIIQRGQADVMIAGGSGSRLNLTAVQYRNDSHLSHREQHPEAACRPFDAERDGMVNAEGGAAFVLERRNHAESRGAKILGVIRGSGNAYLPTCGSGGKSFEEAIRRTIRQALRESSLAAEDVGHVNAHGVGTRDNDEYEARAIRSCLDDIPVTALKSYFGNLGAGGGAVELAATLLAFEMGAVPPTLNYETLDTACPVNVIRNAALKNCPGTAISLNQSTSGQAVALLVSQD